MVPSVKRSCAMLFLPVTKISPGKNSARLPNGLCEAMLSGCIPIGTPVNGIPRAIGNRGLLVQEGEEDEAFRFAMDLSDYGGMRARARARIRNLFPLERRRQGLRRVLETII